MKYANKRVTFGQPLSTRQAIQWPLAELQTECEMVRNLMYKTAWELDSTDEAVFQRLRAHYERAEQPRPLVTLLKRRGDRELGPVPWVTRISTDPVFGRLYPGEIFVVHLASTASHAFRVDVARGPAEPDEVLARLAGLADDPAFVGYPYPLARAHQAARVTGYQVVDVRREFRDALSRHGMGEDDIEVLFQDFHEVLNRS